MDKKQLEASLRLFKSYILDESIECGGHIKEEMYKQGILFLEEPTMEIAELASTMYGKDAEKWNKTFHKSFKTIFDTPIDILIAQQVIHYFTTYGLESLGLFDHSLVYIPHEQLDLPELDEDIPMIVITRITKEELTARIMTLLTSGIALSEKTIEDIMTLSEYINLDYIEDIKNREVKIALYEKYNIVPKNNIEFLRYLILKSTGSTLLINNDMMIRNIKQMDENKYKLAYGLLNSYISWSDGYKSLAEIFLRYKNLFLAFKRSSNQGGYVPSMNKIINRISKLSKKYHKPLKMNILDNLGSLDNISELIKFSPWVTEELDKITIFRELRILNGLKVKLANTSEVNLYKIRNGKCFIKDDKGMTISKRQAQQNLYELIEDHLITRLKPILLNKVIYIPENINYTVPITEKQFTNNIPAGSYIEIPKSSNIVMGIHWTNLDSERVDLDLHMQNKDEHFGWNGNYKSNSIAFSGDIVDAPKHEGGATELFLITKDIEHKAFLLTLNLYNYVSKKVPYEFMVAEHDSNEIEQNYMVNPSKIKYSIDSEIDYNTKNKVVGFIKVTSNSIKFYFDDYILGNAIITRQNDITKKAYKYNEICGDLHLMLEPLLEKCGAKIIHNKDIIEKFEEVEIINDNNETETLYKKVQTTPKIDYDFSLENISKDTIINLFTEV